MRAWKEEYDVCSSLPQSLSGAESEFDAVVNSGSPKKKKKKHDDLSGAARRAFDANTLPVTCPNVKKMNIKKRKIKKKYEREKL